MKRERIQIAASQLQGGKAFGRELYLRMPKNRKMLRIVLRGDEIRPDLLARLLADPAVELFAQPEDGDPERAEALPLYDLPVPTPETVVGDDAGSLGNITVKPAAPDLNSARLAKDAEEAPQESLLALTAAIAEESAPVITIRQEDEEHVRIASDAPDIEPETSVARGDDEAGSTRLVKGTEEAPQESLLARRRREAEENAARAFEAESSDEAITVIARSREEEEHFRIAGDAPAGPEEIRVAAERLEAAVDDFSISSRKAKDEEQRLSAFLDIVAEGFAAFRSDPASEGDDAGKALLPALAEALTEIARQEKRGTEIPEVLRALRDSLGRVADAITRKSASGAGTGLEQSLAGAVQAYAHFAAGAAPSDESAVHVREKLQHGLEQIAGRVSEGSASAPELLAIRGSLEQALSALPETSRAGRAYRETPQIASRFATFLAHSLGYVSPLYLCDLAFATQLYFSEKNGTPLSVEKLPDITKAAKGATSAVEFAGSPLGDSVAILHFLDRYFDNPDCDRTQTELGKRTFESTMRELTETNSSPEPWTATRWRNFVEQGPTITALSLCGKAAAKAQKMVRTLPGAEKEAGT